MNRAFLLLRAKAARLRAQADRSEADSDDIMGAVDSASMRRASAVRHDIQAKIFQDKADKEFPDG